jgi:hypothetical protein
LYAFRVAVVGVAVDTTALRALLGARTGVADVAYLVKDTTQRDVRIEVFYGRAVTPVDDSTLRALGARGLLRPLRLRRVSTTIADSVVPALTGLPGVTVVRAQSMQCVIPTGSADPHLGPGDLTGAEADKRLVEARFAPSRA